MSTAAVAQLNSRNQKALQFVGDYVGPGTLLIFGIMLALTDHSQNLATFFAWGTFDLFIALSLWRSGNFKEFRLPLAYGIIAYFVVAMIYRNGHWQLGVVEYICTSGALVAIACWVWRGPWLGTIVGSITMWVAGIPALIDMWHTPQPVEWFLWIGGAISAGIGLYFNWPLRWADTHKWSFVMVSFTFSIVMIALIFR